MDHYHYNILVNTVLFFLSQYLRLLKIKLYHKRFFITSHLVMYQTSREHLPLGSIFDDKLNLGQSQALITTCCIIL